jgi:methionyl-tRNA formyltransferase
MRVVFIGASDLGWTCCDALLSAGCNVAGILTAPQQFRISWSNAPVMNVRHRSFDDLASRYGIPIETMHTRMADCKDWLAARKPDLLVVIGWYHMIGRSLRDLARFGAVGIHASLLPRYRGGAPLVWAMINGERETGVTLFHFEDGVDDGDIIAQEAFPILESDTIADVVARSMESSLRLVRRYVPMIADRSAPRIPQNPAKATVVPQRKPDDGLIDWQHKRAREVYDWVRAQTRPYPGAFTFLNGEKLTIWRCSVTDRSRRDLRPGQLSDSEPLMACDSGELIRLDEVQLGERVMSGDEFVRGSVR